MNFAIVDIETTGLYHQAHGITEIAVVHSDGRDFKLAFHSMVYPGRTIPHTIRHLTGIGDEAVSDAPDIDEVLHTVAEALKDRVFVAHNVNFDYNFLKAAFRESGLPFAYKRLCTMRMARKILPDLRSHRLRNVAEALAITNREEHRAGGDAIATTEILHKLLARDKAGVLDEMLHGRSKNAILPPAISAKEIDSLPETSGVYYFYDSGKKPVYIGKAKNLKRRVLSHFTASSATGKKQIFQRTVMRIDHKPTTNEYEALLLEDAEIKKWWPRFNRAQKERTAAFAVLAYKNRLDETRFAILKTRDRSDALAWFNTYAGAKAWLYRALLDYEIDPSVAGLYSPESFEINEVENRIESFIADQSRIAEANYLIRSIGESERFAVAVVHGKYKGFGHLAKDENILEKLEPKLHLAPNSLVARAVVNRMQTDEAYEVIDL